jgi:hypothetical protein
LRQQILRSHQRRNFDDLVIDFGPGTLNIRHDSGAHEEFQRGAPHGTVAISDAAKLP